MNIKLNPDSNWMESTQKGHRVWLVKEFQEAEVNWAYEPDPNGCGRIGLIFADGGRNSWIVRPDGTGVDRLPLILPLEALPNVQIPKSQKKVKASNGKRASKSVS